MTRKDFVKYLSKIYGPDEDIFPDWATTFILGELLSEEIVPRLKQILQNAEDDNSRLRKHLMI